VRNVVTTIILILTGSLAMAQEAVESARPVVVDLVPVVARMGGRNAIDQVTMLLADSLDARGVLTYTDADLRPTLRKHRIRSSHGVDGKGAVSLAAETGATHLLLVTIETWRSDPVLEIGLTARVLLPGEPVIQDAFGVAATGWDKPGFFEQGVVASLDTLAAQLVGELIRELDFPETALSESAGPLLAVVPLDYPDYASGAPAAASTWLLTTLVEQGYRVLSAGELHSRLLDMSRAPRGSIDLQAAEMLHRDLGVDLILTGSVDQWQQLDGNVTVAAPELIWSLRALDPATLKLVATYAVDLHGNERETLLGYGRVLAIGNLARLASRKFNETIQSTLRDMSAERN
jgi:hypothetical protein